MFVNMLYWANNAHSPNGCNSNPFNNANSTHADRFNYNQPQSINSLHLQSSQISTTANNNTRAQTQTECTNLH